MITLDYRTKAPITYKGRPIGEATTSVRESFEDDEDGMERFEDLKLMIAQDISMITGGIQITWTTG